MNLDTARAVADATLYEGYILYPYRASAGKNRSRWQFGVVMPTAYVRRSTNESALTQSECVLACQPDTTVTILLRFLQIQRRTVHRVDPTTGGHVAVAMLATADGDVPAWDEAVEREVRLEAGIADLLRADRADPVHCDPSVEVEVARSATGEVVGEIRRHRHRLDAVVTVTATPVEATPPARPGCAPPAVCEAVRLRVQVTNLTEPDHEVTDRDSAVPAALIAVHTIVGAHGGQFVSAQDPPGWAAAAVRDCVNIGSSPVLAGEAGVDDVMLCSPIILYDHPAIAPESPTELYDGLEIDELLAWRVLTLTDAERREARATDARAAALIDQIDQMDPGTLAGLHGAIRQLRPVGAESDFDDLLNAPAPTTIAIEGTVVGTGQQVRLRPGTRRADAQDMFLTDRIATVQAVLVDLDDQPYLAVTLTDDPAADLQLSHGRYLYFSPDEVQPCP